MLFRNRPELAPELLSQVLGVKLPEYTDLKLESADLTEVVPTEYRADLVVLLVDEQPVLGIVIEVQLRPDPKKRYSWPAYLAILRDRVQCDCCVLVMTTDERTARWAGKPSSLGPGSVLTPLVIGPAGVPLVTDKERAKQEPELAVMSAMTHGRGDVKTAVQVALSALEGSRPLARERRMVYLDLVEAALSEAARKAIGMLPEGYEFRGPSYLEGKQAGLAEGKQEGLAEGKRAGLEALAASVLGVLDARGLSASASERERIEASTDVEQLTAWVRRAAVVNRTSELFDE